MRQSFKVSFYLRSNYENKEGKSPVMLRIFLGGAMSNLGSTKIFVDKLQWNNKTSRLYRHTHRQCHCRLLRENRRDLSYLPRPFLRNGGICRNSRPARRSGGRL